MTRGGDLFRLVWGRDFSQDNARRFADIVQADILIHGHEPCHDGYKVPNELQIIIDSCNQNGSYVVLPVDQSLTQAEIVKRIRRI
jgi:hypothetical protein